MRDRKAFFDAIRKSLFRKFTQGQVDGLNAILDAWDKLAPAAPLEWVAYSLATAYHETAFTMQPIREYGRGKGRKYGAPAGPYRLVYYGRGYVQLTWDYNYTKATDELRKRGAIGSGDDLLRNPELAIRPDIAAAVMIFGMIDGWFTGKRLRNYFRDGICDPVNARRIINGTDQAERIARHYVKFRAALVAMRYAPTAPAPAPAPTAPLVLADWEVVVPRVTSHLKVMAIALASLKKVE